MDSAGAPSAASIAVRARSSDSGITPTAHDVITETITRDWIDQPAVVRRAQLDLHHTRQREPAVLGEEDEFDKLERRVHGLIEERRRARAREAARAAGRGLELGIN